MEIFYEGVQPCRQRRSLGEQQRGSYSNRYSTVVVNRSGSFLGQSDVSLCFPPNGSELAVAVKRGQVDMGTMENLVHGQG